MCEQANAPRYPWKMLRALSQKFDGGGGTKGTTGGTTSTIVVELPAYVNRLWKKWKRIGGTHRPTDPPTTLSRLQGESQNDASASMKEFVQSWPYTLPTKTFRRKSLSASVKTYT